MAKSKKTDTITSKEANELRDEMGSITSAFVELTKQNSKLVQNLSELNRNIFKLSSNILKGQTGGSGQKGGKSSNNKSNNQSSVTSEQKKQQLLAEKGIKDLFRKITGSFGDHIDKMFNGKIYKGIAEWSKKMSANQKAGGIKGAFAGKGYYKDGQKVDFKGKIPKGSKFVKDDAAYKALQGGGIKGAFTGTGYYDPKTGKKLTYSGKIPKGSKLVTGAEQHTNMFGGGGKFAAGKKGAGGLLKNAAGGLMRGAASLARFAGPIGAVLSAGKMIFDWWDGGGLAKLKVGYKMLVKGDKMQKQSDIDSVRADLKNTKQMRELTAEYNYKKPLQLRQQAADDILNYQKGVEQDQLGFEHSLVKDKIDFELGLRADAIQFAHQQAMETMEAEADRRKTLLAAAIPGLQNYAKISERALKAIGSSTKAVIEGMTKFQTILNTNLKDSYQISENAQGLAYHFGAGADDVMQMTQSFRLMNKSSATMATKLVQGLTQFANVNKIAPQALFNQMKEAGEEIYKFSSGTAENFAKQAVHLSKMGVTYSSMLKASDAMVLNYKDSIKAEMGLSAMLGQNVDLSETRAKLFAGDQAGAAESLKSALGGMDVGSMNAFQKQQLSQATGMDIQQLMALQQGEEGGVSDELKAAEKSGKYYADGALKQDISLASKRLAMEQEQKKKMLEFEQNKRLVMLQVEQAQRLDGLQLEAKYRALFAEKEFDDAADAMAADVIKQQAAGFITNARAGTASALNTAGLSQSANLPAFTTAVQGVDTSLQNLISSGNLKGTDMRIADYAIKKFDILQTAKTKTPAQIQEELSKALTDTFGTEIASYHKAVAAPIEAQIKYNKEIAEAGKAMFEKKGTYADATAAYKSILKQYGDKEGNKRWEDMKSVMNDMRSTNSKGLYKQLTENTDLKAKLADASKIGSAGTTTVTPTTSTSTQAKAETKVTTAASKEAVKEAVAPMATGIDKLSTTLTPSLDFQSNTLSDIAKNDHIRGMIFAKQYDKQYAATDAIVKATYAVVAAVEGLAPLLGDGSKVVSVDGTGVASVIEKLKGRQYATA